LIFVGPLMALTAILIKLDSPGPVLFVQKRFGFNNEVIGVLKSRTMHIDRADPSGAQRTVRNDPRVTRLGRILRWLSFDELPQLINVIRGDMSLVGPRPRRLTRRCALPHRDLECKIPLHPEIYGDPYYLPRRPGRCTASPNLAPGLAKIRDALQ
jgi:lipopolysaccharide/colanic/teichoic acid biosynthesis glycosyltransferase